MVDKVCACMCASRHGTVGVCVGVVEEVHMYVQVGMAPLACVCARSGACVCSSRHGTIGTSACVCSESLGQLA